MFMMIFVDDNYDWGDCQRLLSNYFRKIIGPAWGPQHELNPTRQDDIRAPKLYKLIVTASIFSNLEVLQTLSSTSARIPPLQFISRDQWGLLRYHCGHLFSCWRVSTATANTNLLCLKILLEENAELKKSMQDCNKKTLEGLWKLGKPRQSSSC